MEWKKVELENIDIIKRFIKNRFQTGDLSGINLYMWRNAEKLEYYLSEDLLLIRGIEGNTPFIYPPVSDSKEKIIEAVSTQLKKGYTLRAVPSSIYEILKESFPMSEEREHFDYIYLVEKLISLRGRKYHKKKNHLNKFIKSYKFQYERVEKQNIDDLIRKYEYPGITLNRMVIRAGVTRPYFWFLFLQLYNRGRCRAGGIWVSV